MKGIQTDISNLRLKISRACRAIVSDYMFLPVYGLEDPQYRERVYCYELYHQLRAFIPSRSFPYSLSGEIDKQGHPLIRGNHLDNVKPDLAVHVPGDMSRNLCVIEVKPISAGTKDIANDLRKASEFCRKGGYYSGCFLLYGTRTEDSIDSVTARVKTSAALPSHRRNICLSSLTCYWHRASGEDPVEIRTTREFALPSI